MTIRNPACQPPANTISRGAGRHVCADRHDSYNQMLSVAESQLPVIDGNEQYRQ
jgi:hypothetical protein